MEIWRHGGSIPSVLGHEAPHIEAEGWEGLMVMDSSCLGGDAYVIMAATAAETTRLRLSPGVTNPLSRHPAVTAGAIATLQAISGGRAVLGIGRGDSALAYLGYAPASLPVFEKALRDIQTLLSGGSIAFDTDKFRGQAPSVSDLALGARPDVTRLKWLSPDAPKVEMDVAVTGPKVIAMAARIAERVTFSVGAIPERMTWALDVARSARQDGSALKPVAYGAQVIVVPTRDRAAGRQWAAGVIASLARFQVIQGSNKAPASAEDEKVFARIQHEYDMNRHSSDGKLPADVLTDAFIDRFAIVGPPDECTERLLGLARLGLERFIIVGSNFHPESHAEERKLFSREIMPALKRAGLEAGESRQAAHVGSTVA